ncbi:MAG: hypothetical protein IPN69_14805 [Acidobacteria bacterium]|nr:hypothetical protein [Acidobacteriota bacterium]
MPTRSRDVLKARAADQSDQSVVRICDLELVIDDDRRAAGGLAAEFLKFVSSEVQRSWAKAAVAKIVSSKNKMGFIISASIEIPDSRIPDSGALKYRLERKSGAV